MVWFGKSADPVIMPRLKLPTFIKIYFYIFIFYCFFFSILHLIKIMNFSTRYL